MAADAAKVELSESVAVLRMHADAGAWEGEGAACLEFGAHGRALNYSPGGAFAHVGNLPFLLLVTTPSEGGALIDSHALLLQNVGGSQNQLRLLAPVLHGLETVPRLVGVLESPGDTPAARVHLPRWSVGEQALVASPAAAQAIVRGSEATGGAMWELMAFEGSVLTLMQRHGAGAVLATPGALRCIRRDLRPSVPEALALFEEAALACPSPDALYAAGFPLAEVAAHFSRSALLSARLPLSAVLQSCEDVTAAAWALHHVKRGASVALVLAELSRAGLSNQHQAHVMLGEEFWTALRADLDSMAQSPPGDARYRVGRTFARIVPTVGPGVLCESWGAELVRTRLGLLWALREGGEESLRSLVPAGKKVAQAITEAITRESVDMEDRALVTNFLARQRKEAPSQTTKIRLVAEAAAYAGAAAALTALLLCAGNGEVPLLTLGW